MVSDEIQNFVENLYLYTGSVSLENNHENAREESRSQTEIRIQNVP
jgi:hypothetical protein